VKPSTAALIGVYRGGKGHQGIHVILRDTPQDTGLPIWVYTVYAHLNKMPDLHVGEHLKMGDLIGPTGNSGATPGRKGARRGGRDGGRAGEGSRQGRRFGEAGGNGGGNSRLNRRYGGRGGGGPHEGHGGHHGVRRPALHFGVYYSAGPKYAHLRGIVIPGDAHWMVPVALFRKGPPFDSESMRALPAAEKAVSIPYALMDGSVHPAGTKFIWPYRCKSR
jgi:hypothetical protein